MQGRSLLLARRTSSYSSSFSAMRVVAVDSDARVWDRRVVLLLPLGCFINAASSLAFFSIASKEMAFPRVVIMDTA